MLIANDKASNLGVFFLLGHVENTLIKFSTNQRRKVMKLIRDLGDVQEVLSGQAKNRQVIWLGKRGYDAVGLGQLFGQDVGIISWDYVREAGYEVLSVERATGLRGKGDTTELALSAGNWGLPQNAIVLPYQSNELVEGLAHANAWQLLSNPMTVKQTFRDKMSFPDILNKARVPYLKFLDVQVESICLEWLEQYFGLPCVVQFPNGSSGNGTFLVTNQQDLELVWEKAGEKGVDCARVSEFVCGMSPNVNVVATRYGSIVAPPSLQLLDIAQTYPGFGKYSGNDYSNFGLDVGTYWGKANALGNYLWQMGYKGIFGVDFAGNIPVEINDRVNGGTGTLTQMCLRNNVIPPIAFHILEMLGVSYRFDLQEYQEQLWSIPGQGFHINVQGPNRYFTMTQNIPNGIYRMKKGKAVYVRRGSSLTQLKTDKEFLVTGLPSQGVVLEPKTPLCKLVGLAPIYDAKTKQLNRFGKSIVDGVRTLIGISQ